MWPGVEPVGPGELRDSGLLSSAVARPFQTAFGGEIYKTICGKAAALFHSLIANHPFQNGNKRTAVLALHTFLTANDYLLFLVPNEMYDLAKATATYKERGLTQDQILEQLVSVIEAASTSIEEFRDDPSLREIYDSTLETRRRIRRHPLNRRQPQMG